MLRFLTAGESHGPALTVIVEGFPANFSIDIQKINHELKRRQQGYGRGGRMKIETDTVEVLSGLRGSKTLGTPISMLIRNRDWKNWKEYMDPLTPPKDSQHKPECPRPGHADLPGALKYHQHDFRNVLERASARETAARTAAGALAKQLLEVFNIAVFSRVVQIGDVTCPEQQFPLNKLKQIENCPVRCGSKQAAQSMVDAIKSAKKKGDTLGGVFEVLVKGPPPGLGSHVHWDKRLDSRLAGMLMSIPAIKGVEIGLAFSGNTTKGSLYHDEIFYSPEQGIHRLTNNAGGIEGGITNGENIVIRCFMKPIPTLASPLKTVNWKHKTPTTAFKERSDVCAVPAASIVGENVTAFIIAQSFLEKFGGDNLEDIRQCYSVYLQRLKEHNIVVDKK